METFKAKPKKWGNSFGVIIPKKIVDTENIDENIEINITIQAENKTKVKDILNLAKKMNLPKLKKSTQELLDEMDKELWPENE